jgi:A/G-specific adenine glycosylase
MAQQTRLQTMLPYYARWMKRFPTIRSLADSREQDVLALWEGLGYYTRARNLREAAQIVMQRHDGKLPANVDELMALPGIGRYTAGAIASVAYGKDEPAVDGNAIRVLARVFNVKHVVGTSKATKMFWALAAEHLPKGRAADFNQALMDLGSSLCNPRKPNCQECPLKLNCRAYTLGIQRKRPVMQASMRVPVRHSAAAVITKRGRVLLLQRSQRLLDGMWEFPNFESKSPHKARSALSLGLSKHFSISKSRLRALDTFVHTYSHFIAKRKIFAIDLNGLVPKLAKDIPARWMPISRLDTLPMGKLDRLIALSLRDNVRGR